MINKFRKKENNDVYIERFDRLLRKKKPKKDFSEMTPYEIINYLREKDVKKNYKVLPSNSFLKRTLFSCFCMVFLIFSYGITGNGSSLSKNINVFVNKIDSKSYSDKVVDNFIDYLVRGDIQTLINAYRDLPNTTSNSFELVTLLSSINNTTQSNEELLRIKHKLQEVSLIRNKNDYRKNIYRLLNNFFIYNNLDSSKEVLDKNAQNFGDDVVFKEKQIIYNLLSGNTKEGINIYNGINLSNITKLDELVSYAKLSIIFNNFENAINTLEKILLKDNENIDVLTIVNMMSSYDVSRVNNILNSYIDSDHNRVELRLIRAISNIDDLSRTQINLEDVEEFIKKYPNNLLSKSIKLNILTNAKRIDDALVIVNGLREIKNKDFYTCYVLSKYSYKTENYNDALNYIIDSLRMNKSCVLSYDLLFDILVSQNKISNVNINYFYYKMKSLDILNTTIDKKFISKYRENFNDVNRALDILEFSSKISIYDADLKYQTAKIYIDQRKDDLAKQNLYEALSLNEKSLYLRTLGVLCISTGDMEVGIESIRRAYELDPNDILNLNNACAYYANVEKNIQRAFSNIKAAYEGINSSINEYQSFIIRENYFKLESIYDETTGETNSEDIPFIDYLY